MKKAAFITCLIQVLLMHTIIYSQSVYEDFNSSSTSFYTDAMWNIKGGELTFSCEQGQCNEQSYYASVPGTFDDFTVTTKAMWKGKSEVNGFGLYIRGTGDGYYTFWISKNGEYCLEEIFNDQHTVLKDDFTDLVSIWYNDLKVTCIGSNIKCFINNSMVVDITDYSSYKGIVGYFCNGQVACAFDDFRIYPPEATSENSLNNVLNENFNSGTTTLDLNENWRFSNAALYHTSYNDESLHNIFTNNTYKDCSVSVKTKWDNGSEVSAFGLRFGTDYGFFISRNGYYELTKWNGSSWNSLVDWQYSDLINNNYNNLQVTCSGTNLKAYINGVLVIDINETFYSGGYTGFSCSANVGAYFDDFIISVSNQSSGYIPSYAESDNFNGSNSILTLNEHWNLQNNTLYFSGETGGTYGTHTNKDYYNFSCSVNCAWSSGETNYGFGIAFGILDDLTFAFEITQNGYYLLASYNGSSWDNIVDYTYSDLIKSGYNNLQVVCSSGNVQCYINNTKVIDTDGIVTYGNVGLFSCGEVQAAFDDFTVADLDE